MRNKKGLVNKPKSPFGAGVELSTECNHYWEFLKTEFQFPIGYSDTATFQEFAYLFCQKCLQVKKTKVT